MRIPFLIRYKAKETTKGNASMRAQQYFCEHDILNGVGQMWGNLRKETACSSLGLGQITFDTNSHNDTR